MIKLIKLIKRDYIIYLCAALVIYGCASAADEHNKEKAVDWNSINYAKIACSDEKNNTSSCKSKDQDLTSLSKGKR